MRHTTLCTLLVLVLLKGLSAQAPAQDPLKSDTQLSPQAAYERSIRPLEITRRSPQNWSEVELDALKVARENAKAECVARDPDQSATSDLLALARLCAFSLQWQPVHLSASKYIAAVSHVVGVPPKSSSDVSLAYDYEVLACLALQDIDGALTASQKMLQTVRYDGLASEATNSTTEAIRFTRMPQALNLLKQREPSILERIKSFSASGGTESTSVTNVAAPLSLYALYHDALALPLYQQLIDQPQAAATSYAELEASVPANISSEDAMYIGEERRQYALLGQHLPVLKPVISLLSPAGALPQELNTRFENAAVFMLFPDWCNQCIKLGENSKAKYEELASAQVRFFLIMSQARSSDARPLALPGESTVIVNSRNSQQTRRQRIQVDQRPGVRTIPEPALEGTPTLIVPTETLAEFAATDFPLLIATDRNGIVRWIQRASEHALDSDGDIYRIVNQVIATWPPQKGDEALTKQKIHPVTILR